MLDLRLKPKGTYHITHRRNGEIINQFSEGNVLTSEFIENFLKLAFSTGASIPGNSYIGLIGNGTIGFLDTMTSNSWDEATSYSESTRGHWSSNLEGVSTIDGRGVRNVDPLTFSINDNITLVGFFLAESSVKGGTSGGLYSAVAFSTQLDLLPGDTLEVTYTVVISLLSITKSGFAAAGAEQMLEAFFTGASKPALNGFLLYSLPSSTLDMSDLSLYSHAALSINLTSSVTYNAITQEWSFTATTVISGLTVDAVLCYGIAFGTSASGDFIFYLRAYRSLYFQGPDFSVRPGQEVTLNYTITMSDG